MLIGLSIYPFTPSRNAFLAYSNSVYPLITTNTVSSQNSFAASIIESPSIPGIRISVMTRSGAVSRITSSPWIPSYAHPTTSYSSFFLAIIALIPSTTIYSSSITTNRYMFFHSFHFFRYCDSDCCSFSRFAFKCHSIFWAIV